MYRKVEVSTWTDDKFLALSAAPPSAQTLWLYLLSGPCTTSMPGLMRRGPAALAEELRWPTPATAACLAEVTASGMAVVCADHSMIFLPNAIRHNPPQSPNAIRGWREWWRLTPDCELKSRAREHWERFIRASMSVPFLRALDEACPEPPKRSCTATSEKPSAKASVRSSPTPSPKASPNQEQDTGTGTGENNTRLASLTVATVGDVAPRGPRNWLSPYWDAFASHGMSPSGKDGGELARYMRPLEQRHGTDAVVSRIHAYMEGMAASGRTTMASPAHFQRFFDVWEPDWWRQQGGGRAARLERVFAPSQVAARGRTP